MQYVSTRGEAPALGFCDCILAGLARDGGLYVPRQWPTLSAATIAGFAGKRYQDVAFEVIAPFVGGEIPDSDLKAMIEAAYGTFRHEAVTPLVQLAPGHFVLELFHGPTLAFKDVAMQLLARMMDHVLTARGEKATIVCATSGDTGGAAIEAFRDRAATDMFTLYPHGRVSPVQRRQMTTVGASNFHTIALEGHFDDAQAQVKAMFNHFGFRDRMRLSGVNSINWGRIIAQVVYFFTAAVALGAPQRKVSFCVPTGNFGDIFAGFVAAQMGLPIEQLIVATNVNDILHRTLQTGLYEVQGVTTSSSPSMDIQVSSNFERLLYEVHGRDAAAVRRLMQGLTQARRFEITPAPLGAIRERFGSGRTDEATTSATIRQTLDKTGYLLDPHTAVGVAAAQAHLKAGVPMITLATAHPAKFPAAVQAACGIHPTLPAWLGDLMQRPEHFTVLPNDQPRIEAFIAERTRAAALGA